MMIDEFCQDPGIHLPECLPGSLRQFQKKPDIAGSGKQQPEKICFPEITIHWNLQEHCIPGNSEDLLESLAPGWNMLQHT